MTSLLAVGLIWLWARTHTLPALRAELNQNCAYDPNSQKVACSCNAGQTCEYLGGYQLPFQGTFRISCPDGFFVELLDTLQTPVIQPNFPTWQPPAPSACRDICTEIKLSGNNACYGRRTCTIGYATGDSCGDMFSGWEKTMYVKVRCVDRELFSYPCDCGDGVPYGHDKVAGGGDDEQCDDGNRNSGDGCSSTCMLEPCYTCPISQKCVLSPPKCGNNQCEAFETCRNCPNDCGNCGGLCQAYSTACFADPNSADCQCICAAATPAENCPAVPSSYCGIAVSSSSSSAGCGAGRETCADGATCCDAGSCAAENDACDCSDTLETAIEACRATYESDQQRCHQQCGQSASCFQTCMQSKQLTYANCLQGAREDADACFESCPEANYSCDAGRASAPSPLCATAPCPCFNQDGGMLSCDDGDQCTQDYCNGGTGECVSQPWIVPIEGCGTGQAGGPAGGTTGTSGGGASSASQTSSAPTSASSLPASVPTSSADNASKPSEPVSSAVSSVSAPSPGSSAATSAVSGASNLSSTASPGSASSSSASAVSSSVSLVSSSASSVSGHCGNGTVDAGEDCDNGFVCEQNPYVSCTTATDCRRCIVVLGQKRCMGLPDGLACDLHADCAAIDAACVYDADLDPSCGPDCLFTEFSSSSSRLGGSSSASAGPASQSSSIALAGSLSSAAASAVSATSGSVPGIASSTSALGPGGGVTSSSSSFLIAALSSGTSAPASASRFSEDYGEAGLCGDGLLHRREQCDDGNRNDGDGCSATCRYECVTDNDCPEGYCSANQCVPGCRTDLDCSTGVCRDGSCVPCRSDTECADGICRNGLCEDYGEAGLCGDGLLTANEECDDGNRFSGDGCSSSCRSERLGCESDRDCAIGICRNGSCIPCASDQECLAGICVAGQCTGPSLIAGTAASAPSAEAILVAAAGVCGDGILVSPEECDDGNRRSGDGCTDSCLLEIGICGDGIVQRMLGEQCESSSHDPQLPYRCERCRFVSVSCGDGHVDPGEECDAGPMNSTSPGAVCRPDCSRSRCGDGVVDPSEACDDGNRRPRDGCDAYCRPEAAVLALQDPPHSDTVPPLSQPLGSFTLSIPFNQLPAGNLPYATLQPLIAQSPATTESGPAAVAFVGAGAAFGWTWVRRRRNGRR